MGPDALDFRQIREPDRQFSNMISSKFKQNFRQFVDPDFRHVFETDFHQFFEIELRHIFEPDRRQMFE